MKVSKKLLLILFTFGLILTSAMSCPGTGRYGMSRCLENVAYILSPMSSELYVFDISSSRTLAKLSTGRNASGLALSSTGNQIYVTNYTDGTVSVFQQRDIQTYDNVGTIGSGVNPMGVAINPQSVIRELYVVYEGDSKVVVFDTRDDYLGRLPFVKYTIPIIAQDKKATPKRIAVSRNGDRLYVTDRDRVYTITRSSDGNFTPSASLSFTAPNDYNMELKGIIVDPNDNVFIANGPKDEIIIFDPRSGRPAGQISLKDPKLANRPVYPVNMAVSKNGKLYVTGRDGNVVSVVDTQSKHLIDSIMLANGTTTDAFGPVGIAMGFDNGQEWAYVTNSQGGRNISIINTNLEAGIYDRYRNIGTEASLANLRPLGEIATCPLITSQTTMLQPTVPGQVVLPQ